ncbi:MAG: hypothetical protein ACHP7N_17695 [Caulobacterales bacterium]
MSGVFDIGRVLQRLFGVLGRNFIEFLMLSMLLVGAPTVVLGLVQLSYFARLIAPLGPAILPLGLATGLIAIVVSVSANAVLQGAVIHGTVSDLAGKRATFGECVGTGLRYLLPLVGIGIVSSIGVGIGVVLLIVPGVLLALAWCVAAPVQVIERRGVFGAFDRSAELTRNHRGSIFGLMVIYFVVQLVLTSVVTGALLGSAFSLTNLAARDSDTQSIVVTISNFIVQTATGLIGAAGVASVYYELRQIKEGVGAEQLAAVFD